MTLSTPLALDWTTWEPETGNGEKQLHEGEKLVPYMYWGNKEGLETLAGDKVGEPGFEVRQLDGKTEGGVRSCCWCLVQLPA